MTIPDYSLDRTGVVYLLRGNDSDPLVPDSDNTSYATTTGAQSIRHQVSGRVVADHRVPSSYAQAFLLGLSWTLLRAAGQLQKNHEPSPVISALHTKFLADLNLGIHYAHEAEAPTPGKQLLFGEEG